MYFFRKSALNIVVTIGALMILLISTSCHKVEYTGQNFSFPPGSKPHENDWEYMTQVLVSSYTTPITKKSKKNVQIKIYDKNKTFLLRDKFEFICASIDATAVWEKFEEIKVDLLEVGNQFAEDDYNKKLVKFGPNKLLSLTYHYNPEEKRFERSN